jgi:hypothetical protein
MAFKIRRTKAGVIICATSSDKLGFFGTAPAAQQAAITKGTANSTTTDAIIDALTAYGLLAKLVIIGAMLALFAFASAPVQAGVTTDTVAVTNTVPASATTTANLGSQVDVKNADNVGVLLSFQAADGAETANVVLKFARSCAGVTWETSPLISITAAANGTNMVRYAGIIPATTLGAFGYIKAVSLQNACTNAITNITVQVIKKKIY